MQMHMCIVYKFLLAAAQETQEILLRSLGLGCLLLHFHIILSATWQARIDTDKEETAISHQPTVLVSYFLFNLAVIAATWAWSRQVSGSFSV